MVDLEALVRELEHAEDLVHHTQLKLEGLVAYRDELEKKVKEVRGE
ncbi:MAG: hypothetical protein ACRCYD_13430 [Plesiomonas sp.]